MHLLAFLGSFNFTHQNDRFPYLFKVQVPYYMKFLRQLYFAILMCAYFAALKFRDSAKILYFESL